MKIAIASTNNENVDEHFGHAKEFYIYNKEEGNVPEYIEKRVTSPYCGRANCGPHEFNKDRFEVVYENIKDCEKVYVHKIGDTPKEKLIAKGMQVVEFSGLIKEI